MKRWKLGEVCEHGSLGRKCEICQRDEEIARLRAKAPAYKDSIAAEGKLREYRAAITALDCWMEKHDPRARSDYWRWRHRYYAVVDDARN